MQVQSDFLRLKMIDNARGRWKFRSKGNAMLETERHRIILSAVQERPVVTVADLCALTGVSEATIRRDIAQLHMAKRLRRVRGGAEAIAVKVYRQVKTDGLTPLDALRDCLDEYQNPIPQEVMDFQIGLAVREASDLSFVPKEFRSYR